MGMGTRARANIGGGFTALCLAVFSATPTWAQDLVGQPTPGGLGLQPAASPLKIWAGTGNHKDRVFREAGEGFNCQVMPFALDEVANRQKNAFIANKVEQFSGFATINWVKPL